MWDQKVSGGCRRFLGHLHRQPRGPHPGEGLLLRSASLLTFSLGAIACAGGNGLDVAVSVDPGSGPAGTEIAVTTEGCTARPEPWMNELGNGMEDQTGKEIAEIQFTSAQQGTLTVPVGTPAGSYQVTVNCPSGTTEDGSINVADSSATFEVTK